MADISKFNPDGGATEYNFKDATARNIRGNYYGTCTGQASNQIKTVTISNDQGFELKTGVLIFVKFDANNAYDASISNPIKLNVNNTGAKQIYATNTSAPTGTNTTYFGRTNYINQYIYNGTYWVWNGSSSDNTINTQLRYGDAVKAAAAVTASTICVGTSSGYKTAASGITFDISYPMLYAGSAVNSGSTGTNFYRVLNNRSAKSLKSGFSGVAHSLAYLVLSSISGNIATIDSTVYTVTPNVEGKMYIPIGIFLNNTTALDIDLTMSSIYIYEDGELKLYGASSNGLPNEVITYEQFRAKSDSEQLAYTGYVTGWPGSGGKPVASDVIYDNTDSGLTANNVQDAIDEVDDKVNDIDERLAKTTVSISTRIALIINTEYTTLADGYAIIVTTSSGAYTDLYINDVPIIRVLCDSMAGLNGIFVKKGSKIKFDGSSSISSQGYFYPLS